MFQEELDVHPSHRRQCSSWSHSNDASLPRFKLLEQLTFRQQGGPMPFMFHPPWSKI